MALGVIGHLGHGLLQDALIRGYVDTSVRYRPDGLLFAASVLGGPLTTAAPGARPAVGPQQCRSRIRPAGHRQKFLLQAQATDGLELPVVCDRPLRS